MTRKIMMSLLVIAVATMMVGMGTFALYSDSETSSGNTYTSGTLDLTSDNPAAFVVGLGNLAPGVINAPQSIMVTNAGTLPGATMDIDVNIIGEADGVTTSPDGTGVNMGAHAFISELDVVTFTWGAVDLKALTPDANLNGVIDLGDVDVCSPYLAQPGLIAGANGTLTLDVILDPDGGAGNAPQGDGAVIDVVFTLNQ